LACAENNAKKVFAKLVDSGFHSKLITGAKATEAAVKHAISTAIDQAQLTENIFSANGNPCCQLVFCFVGLGRCTQTGYALKLSDKTWRMESRDFIGDMYPTTLSRWLLIIDAFEGCDMDQCQILKS